MILAFLQNAYTTCQARAAHNEALLADTRQAGRHQALLRQSIATEHKNFTYATLRRIFGPEHCRAIWWENASPRWGWQHEHKFPADFEHILKLLDRHEPTVVLAFGRIATDALVKVQREYNPAWHLISGPHPAARMPDKTDQLRAMRRKLDDVCAASLWNEQHEIGTVVRYWRMAKEGEPSGVGPTRSKAWVTPSGSSVVLIEGTTGGICLSHVEASA